MMGKSHAVIGGATWLGCALIPAFSTCSALALIGGWAISTVAALGPDLDQRQSLGSNLLGPITRGLSWIVRKVSGGHRKLTHSLLAIAILAVLANVLLITLHLPSWITLAIVIGYISHILADAITTQGVPFGYPWDKKCYGLHLMKTNHVAERYVVIPLAILANVAFTIMLVMT